MQMPGSQDSDSRSNNSFSSLMRSGGGGLVTGPNGPAGARPNGTIPTPAQGNPYGRNGDRFQAVTSRMPQPAPRVSIPAGSGSMPAEMRRAR